MSKSVSRTDDNFCAKSFKINGTQRRTKPIMSAWEILLECNSRSSIRVSVGSFQFSRLLDISMKSTQFLLVNIQELGTWFIRVITGFYHSTRQMMREIFVHGSRLCGWLLKTSILIIKQQHKIFQQYLFKMMSDQKSVRIISFVLFCSKCVLASSIWRKFLNSWHPYPR